MRNLPGSLIIFILILLAVLASIVVPDLIGMNKPAAETTDAAPEEDYGRTAPGRGD